ncbi:hypothetical protein JTB14_035377 [Gonioctena quinquepunctata]|nr:hypothetical protein JTB14_035377 [Gonioctena quinquepunctata]
MKQSDKKDFEQLIGDRKQSEMFKHLLYLEYAEGESKGIKPFENEELRNAINKRFKNKGEKLKQTRQLSPTEQLEVLEPELDEIFIKNLQKIRDESDGNISEEEEEANVSSKSASMDDSPLPKSKRTKYVVDEDLLNKQREWIKPPLEDKTIMQTGKPGKENMDITGKHRSTDVPPPPLVWGKTGRMI